MPKLNKNNTNLKNDKKAYYPARIVIKHFMNVYCNYLLGCIDDIIL